ncbi:helix-turn-helix domain-containing protein [Xylanibacter muris]|uniref:helix-turn-helix domain-containing protein n=1 Tax=Xylanibacter muris TaxID=2736290 RepID=UPI0025A0302A|nr:helix-turn-helix domain-containing protein [Xylanibacter muris]
MAFETVPISKLISRYTSNEAIYLQNGRVLVTPVNRMELFSLPVRLDAITALICIRGQIRCSINLKEYIIKENDLFLCFSGDIVQIHHAENVEGYALLLSSDYLDELQIELKHRTDTYMNVRHNAVIHLPYEEIIDLKPYFTLLQKYIRKNNLYVVKGLVQAVSYAIIALRQEYGTEYCVESSIKESRAQQIFDRFIYLLDIYHTKERCLKFYADKMAITPKYMSLMVRNFSGRNALEWLNEYVVLEAKLMLNYTNMTILEISYRLNFPTQSSFGKYFKQQVGVCPKQYRMTVNKE